MQIRIIFAVLALASLQALSHGEAPKDSDAKRIQGVWKVVSVKFGNQNPGEDTSKVRFRISDSQMYLVVEVEGKKKELPYLKFRLDAAKNPKHFQAIEEVTRKREKGEWEKVEVTSPGIYELNGDDLKICWGKDRASKKDEKGDLVDKGKKADRPTDFTPRNDNVLIILRREK
jgi:uncharacterized protein (TIGR03067 family)